MKATHTIGKYVSTPSAGIPKESGLYQAADDQDLIALRAQNGDKFIFWNNAIDSGDGCGNWPMRKWIRLPIGSMLHVTQTE